MLHLLTRSSFSIAGFFKSSERTTAPLSVADPERLKLITVRALKQTDVTLRGTSAIFRTVQLGGGIVSLKGFQRNKGFKSRHERDHLKEW